MGVIEWSEPVSEKGQIIPRDSSREHLNLRLIVAIPVIFILVALSVGFLAMFLTQFVLGLPPPSSKGLLVLRLVIVGSSLLAGLTGALVAFGITKPIRRVILEAQEMIRYVEPDPPAVEAANEVHALSTLFDQALISFIELVQAREMLDSVNEGIVALDQEGKIAGMNLLAQEILAISQKEGHHKSFNDLLGKAANDRILLDMIKSSLRDQEERIHTRVPLHAPSGKEYLLSVKVSPLRLKKEPREFIGVIINFKEQPGGSHEFPEIIGKSDQFNEVLTLVAKVAPTDSTILLMGESGTGKEVITDAIHRLSRRKDKPFIKLNCAAIPEGLLESELFGHERGAFTGAVSKKPGKFELADGGTIFLDEIGDMSPSTQAKVLRVLQQKEFTPVGGEQVKRVDVRIIAATNKELLQEVEQGNFREDLYYRLNGMTISIPPLRERKSDIPFLADHFLEKTAKRNHIQKKSLSRSALDHLLAYSWPGNVRELENAIERASLLSNGTVIQSEDFTSTPYTSSLRPTVHDIEEDWLESKASLNETLEVVEKELIIQALKKSRGIQIEAAKLLGLNHKNLWHKIKKHKIAAGDLKNSNG